MQKGNREEKSENDPCLARETFREREKERESEREVVLMMTCMKRKFVFGGWRVIWTGEEKKETTVLWNAKTKTTLNNKDLANRLRL